MKKPLFSIEPTECLAAEECLRQGNCVEAARRLLAAADRQHRSIRRMLLLVSSSLTAAAADALDRQEIGPAIEAINLASACAGLPIEALALRERIVEAAETAHRKTELHREILAEADQLANEGRLRSAARLLKAEDNVPEWMSLQQNLDRRLSRFEQHLAKGREALEKNELPVASLHLVRASQIMSNDPEVLRLRDRLTAATPRVSLLKTEITPTNRVVNRSSSFGLGDIAYVIPSHEIVIGSQKGDDVHLPLQGPLTLMKRHALIVRNYGQYWLSALRDRQGLPAVIEIHRAIQDTAIYRKEQIIVGDNSILLQDHDVIVLGSLDCAWAFRLPVPGCGTAILEKAAPSVPSAFTPDRRTWQRVALMNERLLLAPSGTAHLIIPALLCMKVFVASSVTGMSVRVEGGVILSNDDCEDITESKLSIPCELRIDLSAVYKLEYAARHRTTLMPAPYLLDITDPFAEPSGRIE